MKGYSVNQLGALAITFVIITVIIALGSLILNDVGDETTAGSVAADVVTSGQDAIDTFANWLVLLALVAVAAIVIGVLVYYMGKGGKA